MAAETAHHMNGYHSHHANPYHADPYHAAAASTSSSFNQSTSTPPAPQAAEPKAEIPKDEVGWFFVEQYYTTLSRNPEKLHLFYSRRSQFVSGVEAEKVTVAVGQKAINEKIKDLDYHDCKVRVLNVDSQASFENILVSVIGEISNKSELPRKFVQTFVLAEQPNGYYVLNDIIRYLNDEDEELVAEEQPAGEAAEAQAETPVEPEQATEEVEVAAPAETEVPAEEAEEKVTVNGEAEKAAEEIEAKPEEKETETEAPAVPAAEVAVPVIPAVPEAFEAETPKEPEPTPVETSKAATPTPQKENAPPVKAAPKTWANIASNRTAAAAAAAAAAAPTPVIPAPQPKAAPSSPKQPAAQPPTASEAAPAAQAPAEAGWQTAGQDHRRQARPQSVSQAPEEQTMAYIKNVNEKVDAAALKTTLSRFGKLKYFDVNRQKSCAFVEFLEPAGYQAAVAANPHQVGSEQIYVEERRRPAFGGNGTFGPGRGGSSRGRGDARSSSQGGGRGGYKDAGRGGFAPRGRGGNVAAKGRSQPQAA